MPCHEALDLSQEARSQDVEVEPVAGDDVVKLLALGDQLHPAREPRPRHLLVR